MSYTSLGAALRTPKVIGDYAPNAQSERSQDVNYTILPKFNGQDNNGRPVSYNSTVTLTAGMSPLARIFVENGHRPGYAVYLNASGIDQGGAYTNLGSFGGYDTGGVYKDEAFKKYGSYSVCAIHDKGPIVEQESEQRRSNIIMQNRYQAQRYSAQGCGNGNGNGKK